MELLEVMKGWGGYTPAGQMRLSEARLTAALDLLTNARKMPLHRWRYEIQEAITTSDFPTLFGGILDRQLMARYKAIVPEWRTWIPTGNVSDFRQAEVHKFSGNDTRLARVAEKAEYPETPFATGHYHRQVFKYGRRFDISWEALINDAMDAFGDIEQRFLDAAMLTEAWEATSTYAAAGGPNAAVFGNPVVDVDGQNVVNQGVLALTIPNLETTLSLMAEQTDAAGRTLGVQGKHLVVPPRLEFTARAILSSTLYQQQGSATPVPTANVVAQKGLILHVDPNLPSIDGTANDNGTWYVFADASLGRAVQVDFLTGHESPEICMKTSNKVSGGGGVVSPFDGDFDSDDVQYRVRHVVGGTHLDPRYAYAQVHN